MRAYCREQFSETNLVHKTRRNYAQPPVLCIAALTGGSGYGALRRAPPPHGPSALLASGPRHIRASRCGDIAQFSEHCIICCYVVFYYLLLTFMNWKDLLLKSGLPLEFEVKQYLSSLGYNTIQDIQYIRRDEVDTKKAFSYDLSACRFESEVNHFIELLIECKYRHDSVSWVFLPEDWDSDEEFGIADILNGIYTFSSSRNIYCQLRNPPKNLAPLVGKGIEFLSNDQNDKSLIQAISQISYSFANLQVQTLTNQAVYHNQTIGNAIYFQVPIIITTAKLFRLRPDVTISNVRNSQKIEDVADPADLLLYKHQMSPFLKQENFHQYSLFQKEYQKQLYDHLGLNLEQITPWLHEMSNRPRLFFILDFNSKASFDRILRFLHDTCYPNKDPNALFKAWFF